MLSVRQSLDVASIELGRIVEGPGADYPDQDPDHIRQASDVLSDLGNLISNNGDRMPLIPQFDHDCTGDKLVAVIAGVSDIYRQCGGSGYIVRFSDERPDYASSSTWSLAEALRQAAGRARAIEVSSTHPQRSDQRRSSLRSG
jgi:hypothetical protein